MRDGPSAPSAEMSQRPSRASPWPRLSPALSTPTCSPRTHPRPLPGRQRARPAMDRPRRLAVSDRVHLGPGRRRVRPHGPCLRGPGHGGHGRAQRHGGGPPREHAPDPPRRGRQGPAPGKQPPGRDLRLRAGPGRASQRAARAAAAHQRPPVQRHPEDGLQLRLGLGPGPRHRRDLEADRAGGLAHRPAGRRAAPGHRGRPAGDGHVPRRGRAGGRRRRAPGGGRAGRRPRRRDRGRRRPGLRRGRGRGRGPAAVVAARPRGATPLPSRRQPVGGRVGRGARRLAGPGRLPQRPAGHRP
jgi:hypothetical protein